MSTDATTAATTPPYGHWERVKVSRRFFDLLITHPVFQAEPKAINSALYWLTAIDATMVRNDDQPVTWEWQDIADRFRPYSQPYKAFRDALKDLGLIDFGRYRPPPNAWVSGECRKFTVAPLGQQMVADENYEWLYKLLTDRKAQRNNQSAICKRKKNRIAYTDPMMRIIDGLHFGVEFQREGLLALIDRQKTEAPERLRSALHHLRALLKRNFGELEVKEGRIYNRFVALPREYRRFAVFNNWPYVATVDVRACHPSFLGKMLVSLHQAEAAAIAQRLNGPVHKQALDAESNLWTEIFTCPADDPRDVIASQAGIRLDRADMKECLNTWLNGAKKFRRRTDGRWDLKDNQKLEEWFQGLFPGMARVWAAMENRRITGRLIAEEFEGPLMLDPALYAFGDELRLKLAYEYDGVGVFAERGNPAALSAKLELVKDYIQRKAVEGFGVAVVAKAELIEG